MIRTPACGKNGLVERSTRVNQMLDDRSYISRGTLCFGYYENKNNALGACLKSNNGIYNTQHSQQTIHRAPETYAQSDSCKKNKNFSRQAYSFLEEKLRDLRRKTYEGKYDNCDKQSTCTYHSRARCHDISVHSKYHILSLKSKCLETRLLAVCFSFDI